MEVNKKVVVLPSEAAQNLANHLEQHEDIFMVYYYPSDINDNSRYIDISLLAKVIQDYWNNLP